MSKAVRFFFNDTATTEIYTLSLHDALPIYEVVRAGSQLIGRLGGGDDVVEDDPVRAQQRPLVLVVRRVVVRSEEHTSELQSRQYLVCRLLLEKKKNNCILQHLAQLVCTHLR